MFESLVHRCRSYRRFDESYRFTFGDMKSLVSIMRYAGSAGNKQVVRYMVSYDSRHNDAIFPCLEWAGYLTEWDGPEKGERPTGYIVVLCPEDAHRYAMFDAALAIQTMLLYAVERGWGGCIIGSVDRSRLRKHIMIPESYRVEVVVALGKPVERIVVEDATSNVLHYWRDPSGIHHVPKLAVDSLIFSTTLIQTT